MFDYSSKKFILYKGKNMHVNEKNQLTNNIVLGGGCFWCIEAILKNVKGIHTIIPGYSGGYTENPTYKEVCTNQTGHAEVVKIIYDPDTISLDNILKLFFVIHDPTTKDRQGEDIGSQYRSLILPASVEQEKIAYKVKKEIQDEKIWKNPIVTEIKMLDKFYPAEKEHQNYFELHPEVAYCQAVIEPKVRKFRQKFIDHLKK